MSTIRVLHCGLGPVGCAVVKQTANRSGLKSVGGVDIDPRKAGRDLADVVGMTERLALSVSTDVTKAIKSARPDVVVLCTGSSIAYVMPQIETILKSKIPVVSTAEELCYPSSTHVRSARKIHQWAQKAKVAVLGTG